MTSVRLWSPRVWVVAGSLATVILTGLTSRSALLVCQGMNRDQSSSLFQTAAAALQVWEAPSYSMRSPLGRIGRTSPTMGTALAYQKYP
jgi:hypothetical protein